MASELQDDSWMTVTEAAPALKVSGRQVRRYIAAGELPALKIPGRNQAYLIRVEDIDAFRERRQGDRSTAA